MKSFKSVAKVLLLSLIALCLVTSSAFSADRYGSLRTSLPVNDDSGPITVETHPWDREGGGGGNQEEALPIETYIDDNLESTIETDALRARNMEAIYIVLFQIFSSAR